MTHRDPLHSKLRLAPFLSLLATAALVLAFAEGCGGSDPGWINSGPGAHATAGGQSNGSPSTTSGDGGSGADAGPTYRDPSSGDGGCSAPNLVCGGKCVAVGSDHDNCGACGAACIGSDSVCNAGKCGCSGPLVDYCDGTGCMDVSSDTSNCGSCGNVCDPNQFDSCVNGMCVNSNM